MTFHVWRVDGAPMQVLDYVVLTVAAATVLFSLHAMASSIVHWWESK